MENVVGGMQKMFRIHKRAVALCFAAVLVSLALVAHSDEAQNDADMMALKANFEAEFAGLNTNDLDATLAQKGQLLGNGSTYAA